MTNEKAIEILEESLRQNKAIQESPNTFFQCADVAVGVKNAERRIVALNMAISALRAQQSPLDRSRWKGCYWCTGFCPEVTGDPHWDYRFCPKCGRPLTEEAWVELERRIT